MKRRETPVMGSILLLVLAVTVAVLVARMGRGDVAFCRDVLRDLAQGKQSVRTHIAWDRLSAVGVDVGTTFSRLKDAQQRMNYQRAFIAQFAGAFQRSGGDPRAFVKWRIHAQGAGQTVVAADYPSKQKTLLMGLSGGWNKKVTSIQWQ